MECQNIWDLCRNGAKEKVLSSLANGADVNSRGGEYRSTCLMESVNIGEEEMVSLLLEQQGIDVNARNVYGETALHYAALHGQLALVQKLLAASDINPFIEDFNGQTAIMNARKQGHDVCVAVLLEKTGNQEPGNPGNNCLRFSTEWRADEQVNIFGWGTITLADLNSNGMVSVRIHSKLNVLQNRMRIDLKNDFK